MVAGGIRSYRRIADNYTDLDIGNHDPQQRFWRLRETAGTMFWEVSGNRVDWLVRHSEPTPLDVSNVEIGFHAGTFGAATQPGDAVFDNVDVR